MKYVINADDFCGFNNVNQSIVDCFKRGLISQTTVILTCKDWLEDGIKLLKDNDLMSNVGLHVSLSRGYPLTEGIKRTNFFNNGWLVNTILNKKNARCHHRAFHIIILYLVFDIFEESYLLFFGNI